jgi:hypothetical protein
MTPHHFAKQMNNPYFQTDHYKNESNEHKMQNNIYKFIKKLKFWNKNKETDAK